MGKEAVAEAEEAAGGVVDPAAQKLRFAFVRRALAKGFTSRKPIRKGSAHGCGEGGGERGDGAGGGEGGGGELVPMTRRQFDFMPKKRVCALHDARQALRTRQRGGQSGEKGRGRRGGRDAAAAETRRRQRLNVEAFEVSNSTHLAFPFNW